MNSKALKVGLGAAVLAMGAFAVVGYSLVQLSWQHNRLLSEFKELKSGELFTSIAMPAVVEKTVTKSELWRPIQDQVKDTVVQVFAQIAEVDIMQPFKSPAVYSATGSGFFINEQGELITNAHVVSQAASVWIQIPSMGKRIIDVDVIGVADRDIALLRVKPHELEAIKATLGSVPYLKLADSDLVRRSDEVLALGYPLGQQSLKSTTGVISGREQHLIQMSAPINPGSSGGPLLNSLGQVIGINTAGITEAQNVGYIIPINDLKIVLTDLYKTKILRKPFLGVLYNNGTETLTEYLGNPQPGGCYVVEVVKNSTLYKAGVQRGDMIYELNNHRLDVYGDMTVPWSEDKISIIDYVSRLQLGDQIKLVLYRKGQRKEVTVAFSQMELPAIRKVYPGYEELEYEIIAGMVVMPLTLNHIHLLAQAASGLTRFAEMKNQNEPVLLITHVFPTSQLYRTRTLTVGATLNEVNGMPVKTLDDLRNAVKSAVGGKFLTFKAADNVARVSENVFVALPFDQVIKDEARLARENRYALSKTMTELIQVVQAKNEAKLGSDQQQLA